MKSFALSLAIIVLLMTSTITLAQTPPPVQNVPLVNESLLPSGINISNMASDVYHLSVDKVGYTSSSKITLDDSTLGNVGVMKLVGVDKTKP